MSETQAVESSFVKNEPVITAHIAAAVVGYVVTLLVTRGVITKTDASALTQQVLPAATALATIVFGFLVRMFVTPSNKVIAVKPTQVVTTTASFATGGIVMSRPVAAPAPAPHVPEHSALAKPPPGSAIDQSG